MRIRKGDTVQVLSGKNRGKQGSVMRADPVSRTVIVDGANLSKRHTKPRGQTMQGGIIDKDMPLPVSAVAIVCKSCARPSRIGIRIDDAGRKLRVCRRCGGDL
jgi:large subunit ribosomal protein L24